TIDEMGVGDGHRLVAPGEGFVGGGEVVLVTSEQHVDQSPVERGRYAGRAGAYIIFFFSVTSYWSIATLEISSSPAAPKKAAMWAEAMCESIASCDSHSSNTDTRPGSPRAWKYS